ncbi:hypothetical protein [Fibrella aquatilis]|uniref:Glycosyl hydrolase-like 10 domain-containing protein n=1 Tax=Fibrella aquatilis TaxID=2817059 RepID=A0A939JUV5_9BACT|nr:hypothetical protein [Fibrella aquatilis]MBO0930187.1 hypothetical protein [Fibrella aquatilis]
MKNSVAGALLLPGLPHQTTTPAGLPAPPLSLASNPVSARHRNLYNGDTSVFFYNPELWQPEDYTLKIVKNPRTGKLNTKPTLEGGPFSAKAIHRCVDVLADSGVDTFIINANASRAWYPSKTIPSILDGYKRGDRDFFRGHAICQGITKPAAVEEFLDNMVPFMNRYQDLLDAGVDWLAETAKACRRRGVSPWVSIRMNDLHGCNNFEGSFFNLPLLKQKEMRLECYTYGDQNWLYRQGLNYEKPEVRRQMFEQIREVVEDYDFEGLELDWWRQPLCCEPGASAETIAMISDWIREIRALTERQAKKTGRPYPLSLRIPGRLAMLKQIGLDVVTLCREGIIDLVCPTGFFCTSWDMPHDALRRELGNRVAIYGCIEGAPNPLPVFDRKAKQTKGLRDTAASRELMRGSAVSSLVQGAGGIEWFNFFGADQPRLPGLRADYAALGAVGQLDQLRGQPKHYAFGMNGTSLGLTPFEVPAQLPVVLERKGQYAFRTALCAEPTDRGLVLLVQLVLKAGSRFEGASVSLNGSWPETRFTRSDELLFPCGPFTHLTKEHIGYVCQLPISLIRDGWNEILLEHGSKQPLSLVTIELAVR